jgi:2-aminomuconate deaminase
LGLDVGEERTKILLGGGLPVKTISFRPTRSRLQSQSMSESFESSRAPEPVGAFPHAKRVGDLLFLSGIGPRVRGSKKIPGVMLDAAGNVETYDIETQCRAVFENVRLVLEDAGATWNDIVDVTVFLTNMKNDFPIYNKLYAEYFAGEGKPNPTRTTIEITALPTPIAIELKVIAAIGT